MLNLLPDTCTIKRPVITTANGEDSKSYTVIYSDVPCRYYKDNIKVVSDNLSQQTVVGTYKVIMDSDKTVLRKDLIELNSENYIVEEIRILKLMSNHHLELIIKRL